MRGLQILLLRDHLYFSYYLTIAGRHCSYDVIDRCQLYSGAYGGYWWQPPNRFL